MSGLSLVECFSIIKAPRQQSKIEHKLIDVLILCILGVICGAEGWQDIEEVGHARLGWLQERGFFKNGIPIDDTIARMISVLDPEALQTSFIHWMKAAQEASDGKVIAEEHHKGHGRVERRRHWITDCLDTISKPERWPSLKSIGMVEAERYIDGKTSIEVRYFIASIEPDAKVFANAVRKHWSVENQLHWVLDVSFREDDSRVRRDNAAENLGVFRHIAINSLRNEKTCKKGIKAKRYKAALQPDYAQVVLNDIF